MKSLRIPGLLILVASIGLFPIGCCWCRPGGHHCCYPPQGEEPQAAAPAAPAASLAVTAPEEIGGQRAVHVGN